jgi:hypothetical protein
MRKDLRSGNNPACPGQFCTPVDGQPWKPVDKRGQSYALREKLDGVVRELSQAKTISEPARARLLKTRGAVVAGWNAVAAKLESQGEFVLGAEVRYFALHLPPVLTDRERLAAELIQFAKERRSARTRGDDRVRDRTLERTR